MYSRCPPQVEFEADATSVMLQSYFGVEIAESRLRHLSSCYKEMLSSQGITSKDVTASLKRAHKAFKNVVDNVNQELRPDLTQSQTQTQMPQSATPQQPILPSQIPDMGMVGMSFGM